MKTPVDVLFGNQWPPVRRLGKETEIELSSMMQRLMCDIARGGCHNGVTVVLIRQNDCELRIVLEYAPEQFCRICWWDGAIIVKMIDGHSRSDLDAAVDVLRNIVSTLG